MNPEFIKTNDQDYAQELRVEFSSFTGPLDLLLKLVQQGDLELKNFSMAKLATQYLAYIENIDKYKIDLAFEYLYMAAYLTWLKSKLLLPKEDLEPEEQEDLRLAEELIRLRLEYLHKLKQGFKNLQDQTKINSEYFLRNHENYELDDLSLQIDKFARKEFDLDLQKLCFAISEVYDKNQISKPLIIKDDNIYLSTKRAFDFLSTILPSLDRWQVLENLFMPEAKNKNGMIQKSSRANLLLAALELAKLNKLRLKQDKPYSETFIKKI